jgi:hypothetical protein
VVVLTVTTAATVQAVAAQAVTAKVARPVTVVSAASAVLTSPVLTVVPTVRPSHVALHALTVHPRVAALTAPPSVALTVARTVVSTVRPAPMPALISVATVPPGHRNSAHRGGRFEGRPDRPDRPFADRGDRFAEPRQDRGAPSFRGNDRGGEAPRGGFGGEHRGPAGDRGFDGHRGAPHRAEHRPDSRPEGRGFEPRGDFKARRPSPERAGFEAPRRRAPAR